MAQHKALSAAVEVKSADRGEVEAVFATYNVIDKDGDITFPGAFSEGEEVAISPWQHELWKGAPPVGEGTIHSSGDQALLKGRFYLGTTTGRDHFELVKARGARQQWSYGFDVLHRPETVTFGGRKANALRKLKVYEVSPVFQGAGVGTTTLAVKSLVDGGMDPTEAARLVKETPLVSEYKAAIRPHETPVTVKAWDVLHAPDDLSINDLRSIHAWVDPTGDPGLKSSYGFLHHHGVGDDANLRACLAGIALLNSTKSAGLPSVERQAVYDHLARHLEDGDRDVPELKAAADDSNTLKYSEEGADVLSRLMAFRKRTSEVMALRRAKGKGLAAQNNDLLDWVDDELRGVKRLLDTPQETAAEEMARFIALTHELGEIA
jgi:phage head maturation protease